MSTQTKTTGLVAESKARQEEMRSILVFYGFNDYPKDIRDVLTRLNEKHAGRYTPLIEPHFTAIACDIRLGDVPRFKERLQEIHAEMGQFRIDVSGISHFEGPMGKIVFLNVKRSAPVLAAHERLSELLRTEFPESKISDFYSKEKYTPHFTLALYIKEESVFNDFTGEMKRVITDFSQNINAVKLVVLPPGQKIGPVEWEYKIK
ncbi:MAG TPA: 2'-5' RNA ligase family protein [Candidatus Aquilonibacter sp.]|nr:2'-5' RNA ligase family protein [Candidatus Aquilonibacter sp.]